MTKKQHIVLKRLFFLGFFVNILFVLTNPMPSWPSVVLFSILINWGDLFAWVNSLALSVVAGYVFYYFTVYQSHKYGQERKADAIAYQLSKIAANEQVFKEETGLDLSSYDSIKFLLSLVELQKPNKDTVFLLGAKSSVRQVDGGFKEMVDVYYELSVEIIENAIDAFENMTPLGATMVRERLGLVKEKVPSKSPWNVKLRAIQYMVTEQLLELYTQSTSQMCCSPNLHQKIEIQRDWHIQALKDYQS